MLLDMPDILIFATVTGFLAGWLLARLGSYVSSRVKAAECDPRDARIRSLEAEVRVAQSATDKAKAGLEESAGELTRVRATIKEKDDVLARHASTIEQLRSDLKDSVKKTRELRVELTERASENVRSEARLREVETELSVVHASTNLLASGMYAMQDEDEDAVQILKAKG